MARFQRLTHAELPPHLQATLPPDMPPARRLAVARGLVPLGTRDLVAALFYLAGDAERAVAHEAQKSLRELPESLKLVGIDGDVNPKLLHYVATGHYDNHHIPERIALHPRTSVETLIHLAAHTAYESVIDVIGRNEVAVLRDARLLHALTRNPRTPRALVERLTRFYEIERRHSYLDDLPPDLRAEAGRPPEPVPPPVVARPPEDEIHPCVRVADLAGPEFDLPDLFADDLIAESEEKLDDARRKPLSERVATMSFVDKLLLAMHGNAEARRILLRVPIKVIQESVLANPRISVSEVAEAVKERSMPQSVIERVCINREWTRHREVAYNLCWHPKTPLSFIFRTLERLTNEDLRRLAASHNVPGATRHQARMALERRERRT